MASNGDRVRARLARRTGTAAKPVKAPPTPKGGYKYTADDLQGLPLLRKPDMERKLVEHCINRVMLADTERQIRIQRLTEIDIQASGFIKLEGEDRKRDRDNKRGKSPKPVKHNLPLAGSQLDDAVTYLMSIYAPEMDVFEATSSAEKAHIAQGLTAEVNRQGQMGQYYRQMAKMCVNAVKYNFGGMTCLWEERTGIVFEKSGTTVAKKKDIVWKGNSLKSIDAYNFFYDTSVHPVDLPVDGEYFAWVKPFTPNRVKKLAQEKKVFGIDRYVNSDKPISSNPDGRSFYVSPPAVRSDTSTPSANTNWSAVLSAGTTYARTSSPSIEYLYYVGWFCPEDFGLDTTKDLQLWKITIANGSFVTAAEQLEDSHGQLPCLMTTPLEDDLNNDQRTYAEQLLPLQHFASFLMNTHQDATRKAIYGITVFDQNLFPGVDLSTEDLIGARIRMRSSASGVDIDKAFRHYNAAPGTEQNVQQIEQIIDLMQKILPTNSQQQVADLDRATLYQAAATVQGSNRRNLKIARMIADQALTFLKFQMIYNIYANIDSFEYNDAKTGQTQTITPADLLDAMLEFDVGTGLKGIDRLMQLQIMQGVLNSVIQSQQANQQIDVVGLIDYVATLAGLRFDLTQFRLPPQPAQAPTSAGGATQTAAAPAKVPPMTTQQVADLTAANSGQGPNAQALGTGQ